MRYVISLEVNGYVGDNRHHHEGVIFNEDMVDLTHLDMTADVVTNRLYDVVAPKNEPSVKSYSWVTSYRTEVEDTVTTTIYVEMYDGRNVNSMWYRIEDQVNACIADLTLVMLTDLLDSILS